MPLSLLIPIPGVKLGLANLFIMCAYLILGAKAAFAVMIVRLALVFLFSGHAISFVLSLGGGLVAFLGLIFIARSYRRGNCSCIGVSAFTAVGHGIGQLAAAYLIIGVPIVYYLPILCPGCILTGICTGALLNALLPIARRIFASFQKGVNIER